MNVLFYTDVSKIIFTMAAKQTKDQVLKKILCFLRASKL